MGLTSWYHTDDGWLQAILEDECGLCLRLDGDLLRMVLVAAVKSTTGDPPDPFDGEITINLIDKTIKIYADGDWRVLNDWSGE